HEAGQFEHWLRTQAVVPTIRALRERFARVAEGELQKTLDQLARKEHSPVQTREAVQRLVQLVVNKLLHQPTTALREASPDEAGMRAEVLCQLFDLAPAGTNTEELREPEPALESAISEPAALPARAAEAAPQ